MFTRFSGPMSFLNLKQEYRETQEEEEEGEMPAEGVFHVSRARVLQVRPRDEEPHRLFNNSVYSEVDHENPDLFFDEIKPIWYLLRILGLFPISKPNKGAATFCFASFAFVYSLAVYLAMGAVVYLVTVDRYNIIKDSKHFDDQVFAIMFMVNMLPQLVLAPCHWREAYKVVDYLTNWGQLQIQFQHAIHAPMVLNIRRKAMTLAVIMPVFSTCVVVSERYMIPEMPIFITAFYSYLLSVVHLHGAFWYLVCAALCQVGNILTCHFTGVGEVCLQQLLDLKNANKKTQQQMDALVQIIALNPPTMSFAGYVQVNRGFLSSFFSTMVTYLVVLLQFRMGTDVPCSPNS
ncbi:gustatory and odorant receptor 63a isoform X3 [Anabrus simplex]|uniref:gustatory and odorant receptor 63a isoform X3 n=1 Tax=Anabrus simplex TaxID=316456 RepID=UPI0035A3C953